MLDICPNSIHHSPGCEMFPSWFTDRSAPRRASCHLVPAEVSDTPTHTPVIQPKWNDLFSWQHAPRLLSQRAEWPYLPGLLRNTIYSWALHQTTCWKFLIVRLVTAQTFLGLTLVPQSSSRLSLDKPALWVPCFRSSLLRCPMFHFCC